MDEMETRLRALAGLRPEVAQLAALFASPAPAPDRFAAVFAGLDLDALGAEAACMAAWLAAEADFSGLPSVLEPRLRGICRYIRVLNGGVLASLRDLGARCAACGVEVLLLGNAALCLQAPGALARHLWTAEGLVSQGTFDQAAACLQETGFAVERSGSAVLGRKKPGCVIRLYRGNGDRRFWERAAALPDRPGLLLPSDAGLLTDLSLQMLEALAAPRPESPVLCALMDLRRLLRHMDGAALEALAAERSQVQMALLCYAALAPGTLPDGGLRRAEAGKETAELLRQIEILHGLPLERRVERIWHTARLRHPESWGAALGATGRTLGHAVLRRLSRR